MQIGRTFSWISAVLCLAPLFFVFAVATTEVWQKGIWTTGITFDWIRKGWKIISPNAAFSIKLALLVTTMDYLIGLPTSWVIARKQFRGRELLYSMTNVPIAIPGIAMGLALIITYPYLRESGTLLVIGHILYTVPYFISNVTPQLANPELIDMENVAMTLGTRFSKRFIHVTIPKIKTSLLVATILVVTLSLGEFNVSFFLFNPQKKPLPVELYSSYITGRLETAAAITLGFLCFVIPAAVILELLGGAKVGKNEE